MKRLSPSKSIKLLRPLFFCFVLLLAGCTLKPEDYRQLKVRRVIDGDTIELVNGETVRYIGIDTPELRRRSGREWVYEPEALALEARNFNRELVEGKPLRLEFDVQKKDKYGRLLAYVYAEDTLVNAKMLEEGYALLYTYPPNVKYVDLFVELQRQARENNRGLWAAQEVVEHSRASEFIGQVRTVEGEVLSTSEGPKTIYLNFGHNWQTDFTVVIFKNNLNSFTSCGIHPLSFYKGKRVRTCGKIKEYNGPEIIANHPSQIEVIER